MFSIPADVTTSGVTTALGVRATMLGVRKRPHQGSGPHEVTTTFGVGTTLGVRTTLGVKHTLEV